MKNISVIVLAVALVYALTACDTNGDSGNPEPQTVNLLQNVQGANIKVYNHTAADNADMIDLANEIAIYHDYFFQTWDKYGEAYPEYYPGFENYVSYGNNIIVILSDTAQKSKVSGQTLTIYFDVPAYNIAEIQINNLQQQLLNGADPANIEN